ncbi:DNA-directed RNA polymerase subunit A' [bacterium]|nr:DNA-directed RNA polymerase subunit A' [bacterium]
MSSMKTPQNKMYHPSKVIGIQFSILSPDDIRKSSVVEITSRDTYINNKPVIGGLFDPRMGVLEPGLICPTDGLDYMKTPGYSGHIELARPVYYMQYLVTIQKCMKCVCWKCSKLLISKDKYKQALKMDANARSKYVFNLCSKVKRCGEDNEDGCGTMQPTKIRKEGLATIFAEWKNDSKQSESDIVIKVTPEMVIKNFKRISDDDVTFMGFSPIFSRPDWMICQVLLVPPPAVRPSVKIDAQQRSEDDLTHILVNVIKTNKTLQEKIQNGAPANIIDDWTTVLQYYVATQVDNQMPGVASVAQRSGRPLKSIKDRLGGKGGRVRGNLMAKRVDFSARSVITADPNISINELGIPMKIAKNLTKPVTVNKMNKDFLTKLVLNGPEVWPGAKMLEKKNGEVIALRYYSERNSLVLEEGDTVHRHMMDGDAVLFNRQPTLHRMSMMCHIARVMTRGDTFRLNVADTKPYNADFDGDEMNLHMPQCPEAEAELRNLAAVKYQIISPANNSSIVGIFQDSMLGCYQISREGIRFTPREAMNLLMMFNNVNDKMLEASKNNGGITNFDVISQIMPPLSMKYKTKFFKEDKEDAKTSNNIIEIKNGKYRRGQMDKGVMGGRSKGLLQRICNDFGNTASAKFVDDLQNVVTEYMISSSFSVGISDLISNKQTNDEIVTVITSKKTDVKNLIDQVQVGVFENNTGKTNEEEFETRVNSILNQATAEAGKIGLNSLDKNNRFVIMVNAGSKGSELNISQMISCLGQQNVDGKRIPYGFENRTLPHYTKYNDTPGARGFVESSYINGLSPQELFFHAMGGRIGLIDTAVKTSITGYIQRRLIKGMEDLMVSYDMTVRTNKNKIVQFAYGDDNIDNIKVEDQQIPIVSMSVQDIYAHYLVAEENSKIKTLSNIFLKNVLVRLKKQLPEFMKKTQQYIDMMIKAREDIIKYVFKNKADTSVSCPVSFVNTINNIQGQCNITGSSLVDITPFEALEMIEKCYSKLELMNYTKPTALFKVLFYYYLSPNELLVVKRFNKSSLSLLIDTIILNYKRAIVAPGEMVGMIAAQSIGEVSTQMTLNTFHFAGVASKSNVTRGVPRIDEILSLSSEIKNPSISVYLKPEDEQNKEKAQTIMYMLEHTKLQELVQSVEICFDPDDLNTLISEDKDVMQQYSAFEEMIADCHGNSFKTGKNEKSKWIIRMEMDPIIMLEKNITMDDVNYTLKHSYSDQISCVYSDFNSDKLIFRIRMNDVIKSATDKKNSTQVKTLDQSDHIYILKNFQEQLLQNIVLRGIKGINKVTVRKIVDNVVEENGAYKKQDIWVLDTVGTNLIDVLGLDYIDTTKTVSNDIVEIYNVLGIEAARQTIYNELVEVVEFDGTYINFHNYSVLVDRMSFTSKLISIFRHGINNDNIGPIAKASFEETPEMFLRAARHGELDQMRGVSANVMCGQEGMFGTAAFKVILNIQEMQKLEETSEYKPINADDFIDKCFETVETPDDLCGINKISIQNNVGTIKGEDLGGDNDYNPGF